MKYLQTFSLIHDVARAGSIRKAAEDMNITSSALNRQIQRLEDEFGTQIFERLPRGVRLNPAGELLLQHIRSQNADLERVRNQVADLSGVRRGHVSIGCSQGVNPIFLPEQISRYRAKHPGVTFSVRVRDRAAAEHDLSTFTSDLALVFEPIHLADFEIITSIPQPVCAVMAKDHPLADKPRLRLRDCLAMPHVIPSNEYGVRHLLELATRGKSRGLNPVVEADSFELMRRYVLYEKAISFQIPIGLGSGGDAGMVVRELPERDLPIGTLLLGQMRGRTLPVASAKFALQLAAALEELDGARA
ncbi:LysR family transcriptional regulator [Paracoccus aestuariivivens]|uniref:LysR family transcriptional regulator n=1 Tax=Paracoccus aestuariivivens TaxID=1820333 RepID=A0A6L6JF69_9RHOB|nr:LysR family transcriptional regulator [Paracoccus aestuariivivens]MTH79247.1 LysR family transcriptional regulator [Paracoccus aestuariivivens]